jgi:hypothetical protein
MMTHGATKTIRAAALVATLFAVVTGNAAPSGRFVRELDAAGSVAS